MENKTYTHELIHPSENLDVFINIFDDDGSYVASHWHNSIEIIYITSGNLKIEIGKNRYDLNEGDCILINSGVIHTSHCITKNTSILLQIPTPLLDRYMPNYKNYYFDLSANSSEINYKKNINLFKEILINMKLLKINPSESSYLLFTSLVFKLLYELYNNFRIPIGCSQIQQNIASLSRFEPILEYINHNYNRHISIQEIADIAHLQPEYFCRKFKQYMGQTFLEYLNEIRLAHIYSDLLHTTYPLSTILESHGFTNTKLFYKTFKAKFDSTPMKIRKSLIK